MKHELIDLPYERNALEPFMSSETLDFHYGKHHLTYVNTLNTLIAGTEFEHKTLEEIIISSEGKISFGSLEQMKDEFKNVSLGRFGSGWVWLVQKWDTLEIYSTPNAENPLTEGGTALLGCDVWEHSYYIDTRNDRGQYIENFWNIVDWEVVEGRLK